MASERVTSADVARRAGVSTSAVSRAFTPGASVSAETADKVHRAARELDYRPNVLARSMITGRTGMIGLVVANLDNLFYPEAVQRLSQALQAHGYRVLLFMSDELEVNTDHIFEEILAYQVDGLITASVTMSSDIATRCRRAGVPVVLFNRGQDGGDLPSVTSDNVDGGRKVGEFLLRGGHRRIAYIAGWEGALTQRDREAGLRQALSAAGVDLFARGAGNYRADDARAAVRRMFAASTVPDAVFAASDHMAIACLDVLRSELGLHVPDDVSVVGFDDVSAAAWPAYDLTTVRQPAERMVEETVSLLLDAIGQPAGRPRRVLLDAEVVVRGTARAPLDTAAPEREPEGVPA